MPIMDWVRILGRYRGRWNCSEIALFLGCLMVLLLRIIILCSVAFILYQVSNMALATTTSLGSVFTGVSSCLAVVGGAFASLVGLFASIIQASKTPPVEEAYEEPLDAEPDVGAGSAEGERGRVARIKEIRRLRRDSRAAPFPMLAGAEILGARLELARDDYGRHLPLLITFAEQVESYGVLQALTEGTSYQDRYAYHGFPANDDLPPAGSHHRPCYSNNGGRNNKEKEGTGEDRHTGLMGKTVPRLSDLLKMVDAHALSWETRLRGEWDVLLDWMEQGTAQTPAEMWTRTLSGIRRRRSAAAANRRLGAVVADWIYFWTWGQEAARDRRALKQTCGAALALVQERADGLDALLLRMRRWRTALAAPDVELPVCVAPSSVFCPVHLAILAEAAKNATMTSCSSYRSCKDNRNELRQVAKEKLHGALDATTSKAAKTSFSHLFDTTSSLSIACEWTRRAELLAGHLAEELTSDLEALEQMQRRLRALVKKLQNLGGVDGLDGYLSQDFSDVNLEETGSDTRTRLLLGIEANLAMMADMIRGTSLLGKWITIADSTAA